MKHLMYNVLNRTKITSYRPALMLFAILLLLLLSAPTAFASALLNDASRNPANNGWVKGPRPTISITATSDLSGKIIGTWIDYNHYPHTYNPTTKVISFSPTIDLSDGNHLVTVEIGHNYPSTDMYTGEPTTEYAVDDQNTWFINTDSTPPTVTNLSPANNTSFPNGTTTINVSATVTDNRAVSWGSRILTLDGNPYATNYNGSTLTSTITTTLIPGEHTLVLTIADTVGNVRTTTWKFNIADPTPPTISNGAPAGAQVWNNVQDITFTASATDASGIDGNTVRFKIGSGEYKTGSYNAGTGIISCIVPASEIPAGTPQLEFRVKDTGGNEGVCTWNISRKYFYENTRSPAPGSVMEDATPDISVQAAPGIGYQSLPGGKYALYRYSIQIDSTSYEAFYNSVSGLITATPSTLISNGTHTVTAYIWKETWVPDCCGDDLESTTLADSISWTITTSDTTGPNISNKTPNEGSITGGKPTISAVVSDFNGINAGSISLHIDGIAQTHSYNSSTGLISFIPTTNLAEGSRTVTLTVQDNVGNTSIQTWSFIADCSAPSITGFNPANGANLPYTSPSIPISASITDNYGINWASRALTVDGQNVVCDYSGSSTGGTINATVSAPSFLAFGEHTVVLSINDSAGNASTTTTWKYRIVDGGPPVISNGSPTGTLLSLGDTQTFTASASDDLSGIDGATIRFKIDSGSYQAGSYNAANGTISCNVTGSSISQGNHTAEFRVKDNTGVEGMYSWDFFVDTMGPVISNLTPAHGTNVNYPPGNVSVSASVSDNNAVNPDSAVFTLDGNVLSYNYNAIDTKSGTITASVVNPSLGLHTLIFTLADVYGNATSSTWNFNVFDPPPTISSPSPTGLVLKNGSTVTFSATAVDNHSGINGSSVRLKIDSGDYQTGIYNAANNNISYAVDDSALTVGNHTAEFRVKDNSDTEAVYTWSFSMRYIDDTTRSPADGATTSDATPTISITASANLPTGPKNYKAKVKIDSTTYDAGYNPSTGEITFTPSTNLSNGSHTITAYVLKEVWDTDWYGSEFWHHDDTIDTSTWTFTVSDTTPPTITNQTPTPGTVVGGKPTLSAIATDLNGINAGSIVLKLDGVTKTHTFNESTGLISYNVPATLATGVHNVSLSLADKQGVVKNVSWTFDADITAPTFSGLTPSNNTYFADPTGTINFSAKATDDYSINANSIVLKLDNDVLVSSYNQIDSKNGMVQGSFNNVPPGWHTLTVTISDNVGLTSSVSWKIRVTETVGPTVTEKAPVGNLYYKNTTPQVKARVQDPNEIDVSSIVLKVNGVTVTHVYDADNLKSGLVTYNNPSSYPEGLNTVEFTVKDVLGNKTVETWTFTIGTDSNLEDIHGSYTSNVDACMACHKTHQAKTGKLINREKEQQTCYYCHDGAQTATDLREEFGESADGSSTKVSHHKVAEGITRCSDCHNPHGKPTQTAFLLAAGESKISTGNEFCGVCHQSIKTSVAGTSHGSTTAMAPLDTTNITCLKCHEEHSSDYVALLRSPVTNQKNIKRSFAGNNSSMCETCHNDKKGQYEGEYVFNQTKHGTLASSMGQTVITHTSKTDFQAGSLNNLTATATGELQLTDVQKTGKFISPELNISGSANVSGMVKWDASGNIKVRANVSIDGIWQGWKEVANNSYIPGLEAGANFSNAHLKYEVTLTNGSVTPQLREITIIVYKENPLYFPISALKTYPGTDNSGCSNCHDPHGTPNAYSLRATGNTLCSKCHDDVSVIYPPNYAYQGKTGYSASGHGNTACNTCHNPHGKDQGSGVPYPKQLNAAFENNCFNCHNTGTGSANVKAKFTGGGLKSHEVVTSEQTAEGAKVGCENCHNPHMNNASNKIVDNENPLNFYNPDTKGFNYKYVNLPAVEVDWEWIIDIRDSSVSVTTLPLVSVFKNYPCSYPPANSINEFMSRYACSDNEIYVLVKTKHEGTGNITSINSNYTFLWLDSIDKTVTCTISPTGADGSNAWEGTTTPTANAAGKPNPATPGWSQASFTNKTALSANEIPAVYWTTSLAAFDGAYDMQMIKFKVPSDLKRIQSLNFYWDGFAGSTKGYNYVPVEIYLWDFTKTGSDKWVQIENKNMPDSRTFKQGPPMMYSVTCNISMDYRSYCNKCHDNAPPGGLNMGSIVNIGALKERHGSLSCTSCHDTHGSSNNYHLREQINGQQIPSFEQKAWYKKYWDPYNHVYNYYNDAINFCSSCHKGSGNLVADFHSECMECHPPEPNHWDAPPVFWYITTPPYNESPPIACEDCHGHGKPIFVHKELPISWKSPNCGHCPADLNGVNAETF